MHLLVCDLLWTPQIQGIVDTKHMLHGTKINENQVEVQHDPCAHKQVTRGSNISEAMDLSILHFNEQYMALEASVGYHLWSHTLTIIRCQARS